MTHQHNPLNQATCGRATPSPSRSRLRRGSPILLIAVLALTWPMLPAWGQAPNGGDEPQAAEKQGNGQDAPKNGKKSKKGEKSEGANPEAQNGQVLPQNEAPKADPNAAQNAPASEGGKPATTENADAGMLAGMGVGNPGGEAGGGQEAPSQVTREQPYNLNQISNQQLLDLINDMNVGLSGSELVIEVVGNKIILKGTEADVAKAEALIRVLERTEPTKQVEILPLQNRPAKEVADAVSTALEDVFPATLRPEQKFKLTPLSDTILVLAALPDQIDLIKAVVARLDEKKEIVLLGELQRFEIKNRKASEVQKELEAMLDKLYTQIGMQKKPTIIANDADNSLQVFIQESEKPKIQSLIDAIDVTPKEDWGQVRMAMFPLLHSEAAAFAEVLQTLLTSPGGEEAANEMIFRLNVTVVDPKTGEMKPLEPIDLSRTIRIIPDAGTNSLLIATVEKNIRGFAELIRLLDSVALAEDLVVEIFPLKFADSGTLAGMIGNMFQAGPGLPGDPGLPIEGGVPKGEERGLTYPISVEADKRTNTLVVAGRQVQMDLIRKVVKELDVPFSSAKFPLHVVPVLHTDASRLGSVLKELTDKRMESLEKIADGEDSSVEKERVFVSVDVNSNSIILSCSEENYTELLGIVKQLDVEIGEGQYRVGIINCQRLSATDFAEKIGDLWQRKSELNTQAELLDDQPIVVVDAASNSLVVAAAPEDFRQIEALIRALESQPAFESTRIFKLANADAVQIAEQLDQLFQGLSNILETQAEPTFIPDERSNSLIVAATRREMEVVEELLGKLDVEAGPTTAVLEIYPLEFASAVKLAEKVQKLFEDRASGGNNERTPIVIIAEEGSNSIIASASRDDQLNIREVLTLLDRESSIARQVEIFPLRMAKAEDVAQNLDDLFGKVEDQNRPDAISIVADTRMNALIVWAAPAQMTQVAMMIHKYDGTPSGVEMGFTVINLEYAIATDLEDVLSNTLFGEEQDSEASVNVTFTVKKPDGTTEERRLVRQDVKFTAEPRTNSLFVSAPKESLAPLESLIREIDKIRPRIAEIRLFELNNADAETTVDMLTQLYEDAAGGQSGEEQDVKTQFQLPGVDIGDTPPAVGQALRFTADKRTNTVIAAGAAIDLQMVEGMIRILDSRDAQDREVGVYITNYLDPEVLAQSAQDLFDQEEEPYQDLDSESSAQQRAERKVSLVSVGGSGEDTRDRGAAIIVGASPTRFPDVMRLLQQLDRPEPQVFIAALIAEVRLDNRLELGMEFALQDLEFSEVAVLGPNGTIAAPGDVFDVIAGTDLGAAGAGLGGFSFTITGEDYNFLLRALQTESRLEILSRPTLMVENNQEGEINVGDRVPLVSNFNSGNNTLRTQTNITYENVGVIMTVVPHITPNGFVRLEVETEISQLSAQTVQFSEGLSAPVISERKIRSDVTVRDGETVVLGGLIRSTNDQGETKPPILGDLPIFGPLFRTNRNVRERTELLTILTVRVLRTAEEIHESSMREVEFGETTDYIKTHRFMEGLRVQPDANLMGPRGGSEPNAVPKDNGQVDSQLYGPRPGGTYGPRVGETARPGYGPKKPEGQYGPKLSPPATEDDAENGLRPKDQDPSKAVKTASAGS